MRLNRILWSIFALILMSCSTKPSLDISKDTLDNTARLLWMKNTDFNEFPTEIQARMASEANSPKAFGRKFTERVSGMIAKPQSFIPDYKARYDVLLDGSNSLTPHQVYARTNLLGLDSSAGYKALPESYDFIFPKDDSPQFAYETGWHFFVGSVFDKDGGEYGVELMFWQYNLNPGSSDINDQILELHLAISRAGDRHYRSIPYVTAGTSGLISFSDKPFNYRLGNNYIMSTSATGDKLFPLRLRAWGIDNSLGDSAEIEIDLVLNQTKGYVLNGDKGLAPSCGGVGTLYYSVPALKIDVDHSWLRIKNSKVDLTKGALWYDHQWGTGPAPKGGAQNEPLRAKSFSDLAMGLQNPSGWEWMPMQFDDGTEMVLSHIHTRDLVPFYQYLGSTPPGTMIADASGSYIDKDGSYTPIKGVITVTEWIQATNSHAPYIATNTWYPNRVTFKTSAVQVKPEHQEIVLVPIVATGQYGWFASGAAYSEGAVFLETPAGKRVGRGFLESTGYGNPEGQIMAIAGLAGKHLPDPRPSPSQVTAVESFLAVPANGLALLTAYGACKGL